jgi:Zn-dependent peptidase ImmA (M78 family)
MLFTLAHEIGHLLSHQSKDGEFAILDSEGETEDVFGKRYRHRENFANAFASSLLLPRAGIGVALKKIKELIKAAPNQIGDVEISYLSRIFGVSFQVAARRCEDLGLLPPGGAFSLYNEICKIYGSPEKRADWIGLPPRPKIEFPAIPWKLLESAIDKIRSGDMSIGRASNVLNISIDRIMDLHAEPSH